MTKFKARIPYYRSVLLLNLPSNTTDYGEDTNRTTSTGSNGITSTYGSRL